MMRPAPPHRAWLRAALLFCFLAGCGGESSVSVGVPTQNNGPVVNGQVQMPSGQVATAPSALERLASYVVARVEALVALNVFPVGAGVEVRLVRIGPENIRNGTIRGGEVINRTTTASDGSFAMRVQTGTDYGTCRYVLEVGSARDRTLTRAFVDAGTVDVNFESEAAVRLLLDEIAARRVALCDLSADEIFSVRRAVQDSPNQAFGVTAAAINASAKTAAGSDPAVQSAIAGATGQVTPLPTSTETAPPTATATTTATQPPVPTATSPSGPTQTPSRVPTRTATTGPTNTAPPARTSTATAPPTRTATAGSTSTSTAPPTATATPQPTNTAAPTNTAVPTNTNTAVPTATVPAATATATAPPTATATAPPTATATGAAAAVDLGVVAGTAGFAVDVPITLVANGAQIASVSVDIDFDAAAVSVATGDGETPDCRIDPRLAGVKDVVARVTDLDGGRGRLRVGIIGLDNNAVIGSGPLGVCRFVVAPDASGSVVLQNTPEAAGQQAQAIAVTGSDGQIDVSAAPATLGLSAGTAAAGGSAAVTATLTTSGEPIAAVSTDIRFDAARLSVDAEPDCTLSPAAAALDKELVATVLPDDQGRAGVRVGIFGRDNNTALPGGALFTCHFMVESGGAPITLEHTADGASPAAAPIGLLAEPGTITVP